MSTETKTGREKRRYTRLPLQLEAFIVIGRPHPIACTVRDFCQAGMFIAVDPAYLGGIKAQQRLTLHFALIIDGEQSDYQVELDVARVVPRGIGCAFANTEGDIVRLLGGLVDPGAQDAERKPEKKDFAVEYRDLIGPLCNLADRHLRYMTEKFLKEAEENLFLAARDSKNNVDQSIFIDAQAEVRRNKDNIVKLVTETVETGVRDMHDPLEDTATRTDAPGLDGLSLIEKEEFEEFLTVSEIVADIEPKYSDELYALEQRLSYLANHDVDASNNPLGPAVLCNAFANAIKDFRAERKGLDVIYKTLGVIMNKLLGDLVKESNTLLVDAGIKPVVERERPSFKRPPRADKEASAARDTLGDEVDAAPPPDLSATLSGGQAPAAGGVPGGAAIGGGVASGAGVPADGGFQAAGPPAGGALPPGVGQQNISAAVPAIASGVPGYAPGAAAMPGAAGPVPPAGAEGTALAPGSVQAGAPSFAYTLGPPQAISAGVSYVPPSFNRAYSAAQSMLDLRREVGIQSGMVEHVATDMRYSSGQVVDGLTHLQHRFAETGQQMDLFDVEEVRERIVESLAASGHDRLDFGPRESDAIEVVSNLFKSIVSDAMVADIAKQQLMQLQPSMHKVALMDPDFFQRNDHPARRVLNGVAGLRDTLAEDGTAYKDKVADLIGNLNRDFTNDIQPFVDVAGEIEAMNDQQAASVQAKIAQVVTASEEQAAVLRQRRGDKPPDEGSATKELPAEWHRWLDRCKEVKVGDRIIMNANGRNPQLQSLAWIGEDFDPYVFVDQHGNKAQTLTLQQFAMYLRRGMVKLVDANTEPAVDRALYGMLNRMHGQLEEQATHDQVTGFLNRKNFIAQLKSRLPEAADLRQTAVLVQLRITTLLETNEELGKDAGDAVLAACAERVDAATRRRNALCGKLAGDAFGIYFPKAGLESVYKLMDQTIAEFSSIPWEDQDIEIRAACGISSLGEHSENIDDLLEAVAEACAAAEGLEDKHVFIAGHAESKRRAQLDRVGSYVRRALEKGRLVLLHDTVVAMEQNDEIPPTLYLLVGANDRAGKLIPPELFMAASVNSEASLDIDRWLIQTTLKWMAEHADDFASYDSAIIPLSPASISDDMLTQFIMNELMQTPVPPGKLCFQLQDAAAVTHLADAVELVRTLREFGCRFILDEFGSGQKTYDYVKDLQVDLVSIQSVFVRDAQNDEKDLAMVKSINELAHFMGKRTIAKTGGDARALDVLREIGVDFKHETSSPAVLMAPD